MVGTDRPSTGEDVYESIEVGPPRQFQLRAGGDRGVHVRDGAVGRARPDDAGDVSGDDAHERPAVLAAR